MLFSTEITDTSSMGVVNMLGVFIFMLAGIIVGGLILIIEWIIATCKDIDKWNPQVRGVVFLDRFILYLTIAHDSIAHEAKPHGLLTRQGLLSCSRVFRINDINVKADTT